jgi:hypothetical protein
MLSLRLLLFKTVAADYMRSAQKLSTMFHEVGRIFESFGLELTCLLAPPGNHTSLFIYLFKGVAKLAIKPY